MRQIVFIILIVLLISSVGTAHMIKEDRHEGGQDYPDNRMAGYEFLGWGTYGPGAGYGVGPGMMGFGMGSGMWGYDANSYDKFLNNSVDLRRELNNRQFDYNEALRNRDVKSDDLIKLEKEMMELQMKIKEKWWNRTEDRENN
jgi:hypothetical protein